MWNILKEGKGFDKDKLAIYDPIDYKKKLEHHENMIQNITENMDFEKENSKK